MALQKNLKCPKCSRKFSMAAHLGRHMATVHGAKKAKAPKARKARRGRRPGRRPAAAARPAAGFNFSGLSLTDLCLLIDAARGEARRRLELP